MPFEEQTAPPCLKLYITPMPSNPAAYICGCSARSMAGSFRCHSHANDTIFFPCADPASESDTAANVTMRFAFIPLPAC